MTDFAQLLKDFVVGNSGADHGVSRLRLFAMFDLCGLFLTLNRRRAAERLPEEVLN